MSCNRRGRYLTGKVRALEYILDVWVRVSDTDLRMRADLGVHLLRVAMGERGNGAWSRWSPPESSSFISIDPCCGTAVFNGKV